MLVKIFNLKKIVKSFIYFSIIAVIFLNSLEIISAQEEQKETPPDIPEILYNNESTDYEGLKISCRGNYYYYIFDLIEKNEDLLEIYFPSGLYIFPVEHQNIQKIKKHILKVPFLNKIKAISTSYTYKIKALISKQAYSIKSAITRGDISKISYDVTNLNRKFETLINELTLELNSKIIQGDLTRYIAKKRLPITMATRRRPSENFIFEKFAATPYPLKPVPGGNTRDRLLAMIGVNIEIYNKWSRGFNNLADLSKRLQKSQKKLSKAFRPSKIKNRIRKLQESYTNWISAIIQLNHDTRNYKSNLEAFEEFLKEQSPKGNRRKEIINSIKISIPKIQREIEKIKETNIDQEVIEEILVKNSFLIEVKTSEINNYYEKRKFFRKWNSQIKKWVNGYNSAPGDIFTFSEIYDENKKKWQEAR